MVMHDKPFSQAEMTTRPLRHLLFLGSLQSPDDCSRNPVCSQAANSFQLNLLHGLLDYGVEHVTALSMVAMPSFPRTRRLVVSS